MLQDVSFLGILRVKSVTTFMNLFVTKHLYLMTFSFMKTISLLCHLCKCQLSHLTSLIVSLPIIQPLLKVKMSIVASLLHLLPTNDPLDQLSFLHIYLHDFDLEHAFLSRTIQSLNLAFVYSFGTPYPLNDFFLMLIF